VEEAARKLLRALSPGKNVDDEPLSPPENPDLGPEVSASKASIKPPAAAVDTLALLKTLAETRSGEPAADPIGQGKRLRQPPASRIDRLMTVLDRNPRSAWAGIAVLAVLVFGALAAVLWDITTSQHNAREAHTPAAIQAPTAAAVPVPAPSTPAAISDAVAADIQSIIKAMKDCDDEAAKDPDTMYFLVIPLSPAKSSVEEWLAQGESYDSFILLPSKVMVDGLGNRSLVPRPVQYSLSLFDTATRRRYLLGAATGVLKSTQRNAAWLGSFRLGFDLTGTGENPKWSNEFTRRKGVCYWVNVIFRT
jgi:hypothetical protein